MANQTTTPNLISVHGRGSLTLYWRPEDASKKRIDVSDWVVFFEVDGASIRERFIKDPNDPLGLMVHVERSQIETLKTTPTRCAFIDERRIDEGLPYVVFESKIARYGYINVPDATDDA
jgi:hypothetical protein